MSEFERLAFDTRAYRGLDPRNDLAVRRVAIDLASYNTDGGVVEDLSAADRVFIYSMSVRTRSNGEMALISPGYSEKDFTEGLRVDSEQDKATAQATMIIRAEILFPWAKDWYEGERRSLVVIWISPEKPEFGWKESRVVVSVADQNIGPNDITNYAFRADWTEQECLRIARSYLYNFTDGDQLRAMPIVLEVPDKSDPLGYIEEGLPVSESDWKVAVSNEARKQIEARIALLMPAAHSLLWNLKYTNMDSIEIGAIVEQEKHMDYMCRQVMLLGVR